MPDDYDGDFDLTKYMVPDDKSIEEYKQLAGYSGGPGAVRDAGRWVYDPTTDQYTHSGTGAVVTSQELNHGPSARRSAVLNNVVSAPRQAGKSHMQQQRDAALDDGPLPQPLRANLVSPGMMLRFLTHKKFTYAAIFVAMPKLDMPCWFITGNGKWFDTNTLTFDQMNDVLTRPTTSHVELMQPFGPAWRHLT